MYMLKAVGEGEKLRGGETYVCGLDAEGVVGGGGEARGGEVGKGVAAHLGGWVSVEMVGEFEFGVGLE